MKPSLPKSRLHVAGTSLVDVMFAIALVSFASASLFLLYSQALQLMRLQADSHAATLCLQERAEQARGANWDDLTSAASLRTMLATVPVSAAFLPGLVEDVTVNTYPTAAATSLHVERMATATLPGTVTVVTQPAGTALATAPLVRVDLRATWVNGGRTHIRENSLLLAQGGRPQ